MSKVVATARLAIAALLALVGSSVAQSEEAGRTRVTIRGSGSNVTIEQTQAPGRKPVFEPKAVPDPLHDAIQLKNEGLDDSRLLAYLRAHEAELPPVISSEAMARLRRAGAGKSVMAYLATVAAVDIGETGEGRETSVPEAVLPETGAETTAYGMSYGYPIAGGYAANHNARRHGSGFSLRRAPFAHRQPLIQGGFTTRPAPGRRPIW